MSKPSSRHPTDQLSLVASETHTMCYQLQPKLNQECVWQQATMCNHAAHNHTNESCSQVPSANRVCANTRLASNTHKSS
jgi:hypothetical protein